MLKPISPSIQRWKKRHLQIDYDYFLGVFIVHNFLPVGSIKIKHQQYNIVQHTINARLLSARPPDWKIRHPSGHSFGAWLANRGHALAPDPTPPHHPWAPPIPHNETAQIECIARRNSILAKTLTLGSGLDDEMNQSLRVTMAIILIIPTSS